MRILKEGCTVHYRFLIKSPEESYVFTIITRWAKCIIWASFEKEIIKRVIWYDSYCLEWYEIMHFLDIWYNNLYTERILNSHRKLTQYTKIQVHLKTCYFCSMTGKTESLACNMLVT